MPAHWHPVFNSVNESKIKLPVSDDFYRSEISLPIHTEMSNRDIDSVIASLKSLLK